MQQTMLVVLLVLLNAGGIISVIFNLSQGHARWVTDLLTVIVFDVIGFYLLRALRDDA